ncbi:hypothetical protein LHK_00281 [Laribacter hongkongensis HLHK9]|uniref:Uncharacterized protein n=1 Tax=Laribacter hongkongensis (strain HLHK9) TaxID=557598 RepID=C1DAU5_LARHH|nr:hypothetical protein LHK_00281 [Laribacter hongkongensis HLHK9]
MSCRSTVAAALYSNETVFKALNRSLGFAMHGIILICPCMWLTEKAA